MVTQRAISGAQIFFQRVISFIVFGLVIVAVLSAPAEAAAKRAYAGIVVDAKSGKTLYARAADSPRYPASVTKVMTLYVLFQELEAGNIKLSTKMRVSKHAAAAVPTKLGLKAGSTISVENAIKTLVTLSANDISRVIAEHLSGTESKFAQRMTRVATALGMSRTTYRNASGLPDSRQVTTVRDQARLGVAIYQHFPKYYEYFQVRSFKYGGRTYKSHNRLLGQNGVDGIKTGFIRAAGFNLLTAARKNNRHIVVVGFGFDSGGARNSKVLSLVNTYLPKARRGNYVQHARIAKPGGANKKVWVAAVPVTPMPRPAGRVIPIPAAPILVAQPAPPVISDPRNTVQSPFPEARPVGLIPVNAVEAATLVANNDNSGIAPIPQPKPIDIIGAWISKSLSLPQDGGVDTLLPPASIGEGTTPTIDLLTSGSSTQTWSSSLLERWVVQVGTSHTEEGARILIGNASDKIKTLSDYRPFVERIDLQGRTLFRARFAGLGTRNNADSICDSLKKENLNCLAIQS